MNQKERNAAKCAEPLNLGPEARKAFASRQAKLLAWDRWPVQHWYNDEDFCRAYNTAIQWADEVERLRAIIAGVVELANLDTESRNWGTKIHYNARWDGSSFEWIELAKVAEAAGKE